MLNMIRMELYRMFKTKSLYVIWIILTAGIIFTTYLGAEEWKDYTMEEKQEQYEYATGQREGDQANFGMSVTIPTKPGDDVSVFDLFYANIKGKFIALFMVYCGFNERFCEKYWRTSQRQKRTNPCKSSSIICLYDFDNLFVYWNSDGQQRNLF